MKYSIKFFAFAAILGFSLPAQAMVEGSYDPGKPAAVTPWYGAVNDAARAVDKAYLKGMRPHHAGALSMSEEYLADDAASSPVLKQLARGIIHNQTFEIGVLDSIEREINRAPVHFLGMSWQPIAVEGLAQRERFTHAPIPNHLSDLGPVSARDVQFAKAMIVHHQAAVDMAAEYHANPAAKNGYLDLLNVDIARDQTQEIALMNAVIAAYPGDADAVKIDPSMIHGMEGMNHGGAHGQKGHGDSHAAHHAHH